MSFSWRSMLVLVALCGFFCPQLLARASASPDGDDCPGEMSLKDDADDGVVDEVEVIIPCAVIDSGALGADCHDAAFYVVNQSGTLLCRVDIAMLSSSAKNTSLETSPPAAPSPSSAAMALALPATSPAFALPRQSITELALAHGPRRLGPGLDLTSFSPRPS